MIMPQAIVSSDAALYEKIVLQLYAISADIQKFHENISVLPSAAGKLKHNMLITAIITLLVSLMGR